MPEITPDIPYSEPGRCYDLCHLSTNRTELTIDSLSKYEHDKCPDRGSIAGEARSESIGLTGDLAKPAPGLSAQDSPDYHSLDDPDDEEPSGASPSRNKTPALANRKVLHVHNKKLEELREVLANYQNQAKTHRYHADHSSIEHPKSHSNDMNHSS